jgi:tetratricopeptide (TPR) repeat protein
MIGARYAVSSLAELDRFPVAHGLEWRPIRRRFGIGAFGVNAYTAAGPGDWVVEEHAESSGHQELYLVVAGRARFTLDGEELDAPKGTIVFLSDPTVRRKAVAEEEGTTVLAVGGWTDKPFEPSAWEWYFTAYPLADGGDLGGALEVMRDGLRTQPEHPSILYHLSCLECRSGLYDDAREHIRRAIQLRPELAEQARDDEDLAPVKDSL